VDQKQFGRILKDMLLEDKQIAFDRDTLAKNIEKRVVENTENVKTDEVKKEPILTSSLMDTPEPTAKQVIATVVELLKKATIDRMPARNKSTNVSVALKVSLPSKAMKKRAEQYTTVVNEYADKQNIDASLVLAVMHTESAFNPMATSHVPAYGLMQIVPKSAGRDATNYLFGKPALLAPSYLYNDENNIKVGTAYLHLLFHSYLKAIDNLESRLYCAISAYNTGPGNVAKAFTNNRNVVEAAKRINQMTPNDVYSTLRRNLPYDETREYVKKVSERVVAYKK
jgi:membrane-bound lytic murein transglycosylase C